MFSSITFSYDISTFPRYILEKYSIEKATEQFGVSECAHKHMESNFLELLQYAEGEKNIMLLPGFLEHILIF